jgi:hypothetical protein
MRKRTQSPSGYLALSLLGALGTGCAHAPPAPPRMYTPVLTKADVMGPTVPPVYMHVVANDRTVLERATEARTCSFGIDVALRRLSNRSPTSP